MKRGIIIANTGSPDAPTPEAVEVYLRQFLSHPRICPMRPFIWKFILNRHILPSRRVSSAEKYAGIWKDGGFQFIRDHEELARKLERALNERGEDVRVLSAMSFGNPSIESAMHTLRKEGCEKLTVLPLYPQSAFSQAYIVADEVRANAQSTGWEDASEIIGDYSRNERYLESVAASIGAAGFDASRGDRIIFGFPSIPRVDVERGDTYEQMVNLTCDTLADRLSIPREQWAIGFQCQFDKGRTWLEPFSPTVLRAWVEEGFAGRLFYACPNFSVDCLETYRDVDVVLRTQWDALLHERGTKTPESSFTYVPCLNASDEHVEVLVDVISNPICFI